MDNDSTRNSGRLSLQERARLGLLVEEPELWLHEVAELESTGNDMNRQVFETLLHGLAIHCGGCSMQSLPFPRFCPVKNRVVIVAWRIPRKVYLLLRPKIQPNPPAGSLIHLWLGATPAVETLPPAEPSLPEPARPARAKGGAAKKTAALLALLDEVDKRAAKQDKGFNRDSLPGTRAEFHELLKAYCPAFKYIKLGKYTKGKCKFQHGVNQKNGRGAAIWVLFPEYDLKLG